MNNRILAFAILVSALPPIGALAQAPSLTIQVDHPTGTVSPTLYGLMTEEINYSYDGGLYPELIRDRVLSRSWDALRLWPMVARGDSIVNVSADESDGPSAALPRSLRVTVAKASAASPAGVENGGYWGIPVRPHTAYSGSFYAKTDSPGILCHYFPTKRSNRSNCRIGHGRRPHRRMEAIHIYFQDCRCTGLVEQPSHPHNRSARDDMAQSGLPLSAHLPRPAWRKSRRHHEFARCYAAQIPALSRRQLS